MEWVTMRMVVPSRLGVEVTGGLVGEDELGVGDDGAGDGDSLLLTS